MSHSDETEDNYCHRCGSILFGDPRLSVRRSCSEQRRGSSDGGHHAVAPERNDQPQVDDPRMRAYKLQQARKLRRG
jgi:hypothetical protein